MQLRAQQLPVRLIGPEVFVTQSTISKIKSSKSNSLEIRLKPEAYLNLDLTATQKRQKIRNQ